MCYAGGMPGVDCDEWEEKTPSKLPKKVKKSATHNRKAKRKNYDPTRTLSLRQAFSKQIRLRFKELRRRIKKLVVEEDAFGISRRNGVSFGLKEAKPFALNAALFRSDPTCGPDALIEVQDVRQPNDWYCGATAVNTNARLRGLNPGSVRSTAGELGTTVERSTHPSAIVGYFARRGVHVEASSGLSIDDLRDYHRKGMPVICCVQDYMGRRDPKAEFDYGHYLTVIGVGFGYVFCQDSSLENWELVGKDDPKAPGGDVPKSKAQENNIDAPGRIMVREDEWMRVWHDKDKDGVRYIRWGCAIGWKDQDEPDERTYSTSNTFCATGPGGGIDATCSPGGAGAGPDTSHPEADSKMSKVLSIAKHMPAHMYNKIKSTVQTKYAKLSKRYGPTYAKAIIGAALVGLPVPLPGASFASASLVIAVAELHRLARGSKTHNVLNTEQEMDVESIHKAANELIRELKAELTTNADFSFESSPEQLRKFQEWLRQQYASLLTGKTEEELWRVYTEQGFKRGAGRAFDDVNSGYYAGKMMDEGGLDFMAGGRDQFLRSAFGRPETPEKVQLLASRSFTDLVNVTEDMATKMGRVLVDGLVTGSNPREIADNLDDVLDIGLQRADVIARTEIIRAHAEGQLDAFDKLGVDEIGVEVEWSTAGDERVCPECEDMEGKVYSVEEAHGMIPLHPQCRCAFIPVVPEDLKKDIT
jgi:SPP1 gp7 family putative phage head morphogenesis protein